MYKLTVAGQQSLFHNAFKEFSRRAVIQKLRRRALLHVEYHVNGMSLIGADFCSVFVKTVASLAVGSYDGFENRAVNVMTAARIDALHQFIDVRPRAHALDLNADNPRLVPQNLAEKAAQSDKFFAHLLWFPVLHALSPLLLIESSSPLL